MDLVNTSIEDTQIHKAFLHSQPRFSKEKGERQGEIEVVVTAKVLS